MPRAAELSTFDVERIVDGSETHHCSDLLAVEEPLEIRLAVAELPHRPVSITMRTPGHDDELAAGFLYTEGIIKRPGDVRRIRNCGKGGNTVVVELASGIEVDLKRLERNFYTTSSCGVCGKSSIEAISTGADPLPQTGLKVGSGLINELPGILATSQAVFAETGGLHAAALFSADGKLAIVREDVGRHNALDKVIGSKFLSGELPLRSSVLLVSGRSSFELVQKALMAGIPIMTAVGAPSSLAVELAREFGMTLAGFVRDGRFNVYAGGDRIE